jgi:hypothetical protein
MQVAKACAMVAVDGIGRREEGSGVDAHDVLNEASAEVLAAVRRLVPAAALPDGRLSRPALSDWVHGAGSLDDLVRAVTPWSASVCPLHMASHMWGWERSTQTFLAHVTAQLNYTHPRWWARRTPHDICNRARPENVQSMSTEELEKVLKRCPLGGTTLALRYAQGSVPVFELAYMLRRFESSRWTFLSYRDLFLSNRSRLETIEWLAALFGLRVSANARTSGEGCDFSEVVTHFSRQGRRARSPHARTHEAARAAFEPWQVEIERLVAARRRAHPEEAALSARPPAAPTREPGAA